MPFPIIHAAVMCEEMREERHGLATLLGFYGVLPDVEVAVQNFAQPVRLGFVFLGGLGDGNSQVSLRIRTSQDQDVLPAVTMAVNIVAGKRANLAFQLVPGLILPGPDTYRVELLVNGNPNFSTTFVARQGQPADLV